MKYEWDAQYFTVRMEKSSVKFHKKCPRNQHLRYGAIIQSAKEARSKKGRQG